MSRNPTRTYTIFAAGLLGLQGTSTLAALTFPAVDRALPALLDVTRMVEEHSTLHIVSAIVAVGALASGRTREFALGFGLFYSLLGVSGWLADAKFFLDPQPFDHPFHLVLGSLGIIARVRQPDREKGQVAI